MDQAFHGQSGSDENTTCSSTPRRAITSSAVIGTEPFRPWRKAARIGIFRRTHIGVFLMCYKGTVIDYGKSGQRTRELKSNGCVFWIDLPAFQATNSRNEWTQEVTKYFSIFRVPEDAHPSAIRGLFEVLDAVVTPELPIHFDIYDLTFIEQDAHHSVGNLRLFGPELSCAICLEDYPAEDGEAATISRWPCGHHYHKDCSDEWLKRSTVCPLCRFDLS